MTEPRTLIRDVVHTAPDGESVRITQRVLVEISWPPDPPSNYDMNGRRLYSDWRLVPLPNLAQPGGAK